MLVRRRLARRPCVVPPDRASEPVIGREVQGNADRERSRTSDGNAGRNAGERGDEYGAEYHRSGYVSQGCVAAGKATDCP